MTELYGGGLDRVVELARERRARARRPAPRRRAGRQPAARARPASRVGWPPGSSRRSSRCGPFLATHDGDVELLDVDEDAGAVHLRLLGSCDGCPSSAVTLQRRGRAGDRRGGARDRDHRRRAAVDRGARTGGDRHAGDPDPQAGAALRELPDRGRGAMSGDPLAAVRRLRRAPSAAAPGRASAASCAASRSGPSTATSSTSSTAASCAPAGPATCSSRPTVPAAATTGRCRIGTSRSPTSGCRRARVGRAPDPGERRVLLRELEHRPRRRVLPGPGGRDRVAAAARHVGRARDRPTPSWRRCSPTSRRSSCAPYAVPTRRSASSCRSTRATSWSVGCGRCGGASTAGRRRTRRSTHSSLEVRARAS